MQKKDKIEEEVKTDEIPEFSRGDLTIQDFMNDMRLLDDQLKDRNLVKPVFNFGDLGVTNYLLWLILGELTILNDDLGEE